MNDTNSCPAGSVRIDSARDCKIAALESSWTWKGVEKDSSSPKGCYRMPWTTQYELRTAGRCLLQITSISECTQAAVALKVTSQEASNDKQTKKPFDPPGCYFESERLKLNEDGTNNGTCSEVDKCLCKVPPTVSSSTPHMLTAVFFNLHFLGLAQSKSAPLCIRPTSSPTGLPTFAPSKKLEFNSSTPTQHPTATPSLLPSQNLTLAPTFLRSNLYELQTAGRCLLYITSMSECTQAARALNLTSTKVSNDQQRKSTYPPGCYFERFFTSLKLNVDGTNTGTCSQDSECLCKLPAPPTYIPTFVPTQQSEFDSTTPTAAPTPGWLEQLAGLCNVTSSNFEAFDGTIEKAREQVARRHAGSHFAIRLHQEVGSPFNRTCAAEGNPLSCCTMKHFRYLFGEQNFLVWTESLTPCHA